MEKLLTMEHNSFLKKLEFKFTRVSLIGIKE